MAMPPPAEKAAAFLGVLARHFYFTRRCARFDGRRAAKTLDADASAMLFSDGTCGLRVSNAGIPLPVRRRYRGELLSLRRERPLHDDFLAEADGSCAPMRAVA